MINEILLSQCLGAIVGKAGFANANRQASLQEAVDDCLICDAFSQLCVMVMNVICGCGRR